MGKEKAFNRTPKDSKGMLSHIAHRISVGKHKPPEIPFAGRPQTVRDLFDIEADAHQLQSVDFEHDDTLVRELRPDEIRRQPSMDQYLPGVGQEIELFVRDCKE